MSEQDQKRVPFKNSPTGVADHPWVNKPDTMYNADGVYKVNLQVTGPEGMALKEALDADVDKAFDELTADLPANKRKDWTKQYPYEALTDDKGETTGVIEFHFRQNAIINLPDGEKKPVKIGIFTAKDAPEPDAKIYSGSKLRVRFKPRYIKVASAKKAGLRLDFIAVQIIELVTRQRDPNSGGFGATEGYQGSGDESAADAVAQGGGTREGPAPHVDPDAPF